MKNSSQIRHFLTLIGSSIVLIALVTSACRQSEDITHLPITFEASVNGLPLITGTDRYKNPNGEGEFLVENFKFYISNLRLLDYDNRVLYSEMNSYHLLRFNDGDVTLLLEVPKSARSFRKIQFSIGVDSIANESITQLGDLNPNGSMAWSWTTGYKFLVMEGNFFRSDRSITPLVYHIGFSENYRTLVFEPKSSDTEIKSLTFKVELSSIFKGEHIVNFESMPSVTFNRKNAQFVSKNLGGIISLGSINQ